MPEGYKIEATAGNNLPLKRPDGSPVVVFEFSAFGPDPDRIMKVAWDDDEWIRQAAGWREHSYRQAEQRSLTLLPEGLDLGTGGETTVSREGAA